MLKNQNIYHIYECSVEKDLSNYLLSRHLQAREPNQYFCADKTEEQVPRVYSEVSPFHIQKVQCLNHENQVVNKLQTPS